MKRISVVFLQAIIVLVGIAALVFMLWEPHLEGRNVNATLFEIYFQDLFLACAYAASILFFTALYQTFRLLGRIKRDELVSLGSMKALQIIRNCSITLAILVAWAVAYLFAVERGKGDDIAGGVAMGLFVFFVSIVAAVSADLFRRHLQRKSPSLSIRA